jgi:hypothetical protein
VNILPGSPRQALKTWLELALSLYTSIPNRTPELLSLLLYPILHKILFIPEHANMFKELVTLREPDYNYNKDWNIAVHNAIASLLRADIKNPVQLSRIPADLVQNKELQQELADFCSRYVEQAEYKEKALQAIAPIFDMVKQKGAVVADLFSLLSSIAKACSTDKKDVGAIVAAFMSMSFHCAAFGDIFDPNNEDQLNAAKNLLSNRLCNTLAPWRINNLDRHLYTIEEEFSNRPKFPALYSLLAKAMGDLVLESLLNEHNKDFVQGFPEVCAQLQRLLPSQKGGALISSYKLRVFIKALGYATQAFESIKYDLPRETALLFGLCHVNHGTKNKAEKDQETCPFCNAAVPLVHLEEHFNLHLTKQPTSSPALADLWKTYLLGADKFKVQFHNHLRSFGTANYSQKEAEKLVGCLTAYIACSSLWN